MTAQSGLGFSGIVAIQIPDDGAPGFVLTKLTADNYDYDWLAGGGGASTIIVEDEGVPVGVPADTLDFVGAGVTASGAGTTKTITIPGGSSTMQDTYDATGVTQPKMEVIAANGAITFRDAAVSIGDIFILEDNGGIDFFNVAESLFQFSVSTQRLFEFTNFAGASPGYGAIEFYPDTFTRTLLADKTAAIQWLSVLTSSVAGGGGIGNEHAPNCIDWDGEIIFTEQANLFNSQSLFNQRTLVSCDGGNTGPIYTMINQPIFRNIGGGAATGSQQNAVRSQMRVGPNISGGFTLATHETYFATVIVDATVSLASITNVNYFAPKAPSFTAGGTVGTLNLIDFPDIPISGISTLRGLNSAMDDGVFINHTGSAPSFFEGDITTTQRIHMDTYVEGFQWGELSEMIVRYNVVLADTPGDVWTWQWAGGVPRMYWKFWTGFDYWTQGHNQGEQSAGDGSGVQIAFDKIVYSKGLNADPNDANGFVIFSGANLRRPNLAGGYADVLWTAGGSIDIDGLAMSDVSAFQINSISTILSGGSVDDSSSLYVAGMQSANATLVQSLRVLGRSTLRGRINQPSDQRAQILANQDDYQLAPNNAQRGVVILDSDAAYNITGIDSSFGFSQDGERITLINRGSFNLTLTDEDAASAAANRFISPSGVDYILGPNESCEIYYLDDGTDRWLILWGSGA